MSATRFIKAATTTVAPAKSMAECERLLRRYGAVGFSTAQDYENGRIVVSFVLPDSGANDAPKVPVKLPVHVRAIYDAMYGRPTRYGTKADGTYGYVFDPKGYDAKKLLQAERTAWRNLVDCIDAALSAASAGLQTITEAFFAHAVVGDRGERMIEVVESMREDLGMGVQRLLANPDAPATGGEG